MILFNAVLMNELFIIITFVFLTKDFEYLLHFYSNGTDYYIPIRGSGSPGVYQWCTYNHNA